jgi:diguanylate cyclase (GGDEF)-like protein
MNQDNKQIKDKLSLLVRRYTKQLPSKLKIIESLLRDIIRDPLDRTHYEILYNEIHSLSGSSLTYGFKEIGATSRELEKMFETFISNNAMPSEPQQQELMTLFYNLQKQIQDACNLTAVPAPEAKSGQADKKKPEKLTSKKIILLTKPENNRTAMELAAQLHFYGFEIPTYFNVDDIKKLKLKTKEVFFILDDYYLDVPEQEFEYLKTLRLHDPKNIHFIFIASNDTFEKRLQAVRRGADSFFVLPLDITELLDNLHTFSGEQEEEPFHVLIVDDDPEQISWGAFWLQQAGMITSVVSNPLQVIPQIIETKPELILMDINMPHCNGLELAKIIRQQKAFVSVPIIFLSIESNIYKQYQALNLGGDDFLTKPIKPDHLVSSVSIRAARYRKLRFYMERDSLTGLLNHSRSNEQLEVELRRAERLGLPLSYSMIDIDFFKRVNDSYGHLTGDRVLKSLSNLLKERLRQSDIIGRYGGEEFAVILPNTTAKNATAVIDEIRNNFSLIKHRAGDNEFFVTISAGIASFPAFSTMLSLSEAADNALYLAKQKGRNRVECGD